MLITKKYLRVEHIESYDALNLLHVNILRAMIEDTEDITVELTWIRL
jgi:hypothetical protein